MGNLRLYILLRRLVLEKKLTSYTAWKIINRQLAKSGYSLQKYYHVDGFWTNKQTNNKIQGYIFYPSFKSQSWKICESLRQETTLPVLEILGILQKLTKLWTGLTHSHLSRGYGSAMVLWPLFSLSPRWCILLCSAINAACFQHIIPCALSEFSRMDAEISLESINIRDMKLYL